MIECGKPLLHTANTAPAKNIYGHKKEYGRTSLILNFLTPLGAHTYMIEPSLYRTHPAERKYLCLWIHIQFARLPVTPSSPEYHENLKSRKSLAILAATIQTCTSSFTLVHLKDVFVSTVTSNSNVVQFYKHS